MGDDPVNLLDSDATIMTRPVLSQCATFTVIDLPCRDERQDVILFRKKKMTYMFLLEQADDLPLPNRRLRRSSGQDG